MSNGVIIGLTPEPGILISSILGGLKEKACGRFGELLKISKCNGDPSALFVGGVLSKVVAEVLVSFNEVLDSLCRSYDDDE